MRRSVRLAAVSTALLLLIPVATAQASPGQSVYFDVHTYIPAGGGGHGPFTATGQAVEDGLVCASGTTQDVSLTVAGNGPKSRVNYQVLKSFTCDDGTGIFTLKLQVRSDPDRGGTYSWTVSGGTGDYLKLQGSGTGYGEPSEAGSDYQVHDVLAGTLH